LLGDGNCGIFSAWAWRQKAHPAHVDHQNHRPMPGA
jgi:hypothetical protein